MKTFLEFLQEECGSYTLREILDNLTDDQIIHAVEEYSYERSSRVLMDMKQDYPNIYKS